MDRSRVLFHDGSRIDGVLGPRDRGASPWILITQARFAASVNQSLLGRALADADADVIAVNAAPDLLAYRESVRLTRSNELAGFRRLYSDSMACSPIPLDWPHHLWVRREAFEAVVMPNVLEDFGAVVGRCRAHGLRMQGMAVAGVVHDLESPEGILALCRAAARPFPGRRGTSGHSGGRPTARGDGDASLSDRSRLIGRVWLGRRVTVEPGAVIVGPTVLCDGCTVQRDAVVDSSVVGAHASIPPGRVLREQVVASPGPHPGQGSGAAAQSNLRRPVDVCAGQENVFRTWPRFSYARCAKRVADALAAALVLVLFAPVFPLIAVAIKLSSPGPVFFRDKRQGLHGTLFDCIKFRTMRPGADKMQEKLRFVCEVDGPQFKINDDPRITTVGRFLRETYLDEIPQFLNVLCGQMSVVGPRPSPESENTLCPSWRDARLSVRPGITGLWQVCRTREANKDFQEWIHFDTQYVRGFSPGLDLWICWRTFWRMVENFVNQF
jgi:lipopolysaccharide/colanic/teichoic acid biosynthesis glycosyltransferase/carbonic anhydrase/acetyltransferase-like protein (isoleucine patch superfamily)